MSRGEKKGCMGKKGARQAGNGLADSIGDFSSERFTCFIAAVSSP
jgi:hypothetical protein